MIQLQKNSMFSWGLFICIIIQILVITILTYGLQKLHKKGAAKFGSAGISVVICARNEAENLQSFLPEILNQNYSNYEVIVVNDASGDNTKEVLLTLRKEYNNLVIIEISESEKTTFGKKQAILKGIEEASKEWIVFTDADCRPHSDLWLSQLSGYFTEGTSVVLGYSPVLEGHGLTGYLQRFENYTTALFYLGFASLGFPYMGVGRNLAFRKNFIQQNIDVYNLEISSGDDDLTVNQLCNKENTAICLERNSWMETFAQKSFADYLSQKKRHFSVSKHYRHSTIFPLMIINSSKILIYFGIIVLLFFNLPVHKIIWPSLLFYWILLYIGSYLNTKVLGNRQLVLFAPILDALSIFFNSFVVVTNLFSRKSGWK